MKIDFLPFFWIHDNLIFSVKKKSEKPIFAIVGPTASGKTELGVALALRIGNCEIINCDSVQIYKKIQIATAKPNPKEMRGVPHHLLDYVSPEINYTAADWVKDASEKIKEIEMRKNTPILVGGTGFYLRTLRKPLFKSPKTNNKLRLRLTEIRRKKGAEHLHKILWRVDKKHAQKVSLRDYIRVQRALEFCLQTRKKFSEFQPKRTIPPKFANRIRIFALRPPRDTLYQIINQRTEKHFANGLLEEVRILRERGLKDETNALGSHGYRRACEFLRGERTLESAIKKTKQDVRNYAKRQLTWFRRENDVVWIEGFGNDCNTQHKLFRILSLE